MFCSKASYGQVFWGWRNAVSSETDEASPICEFLHQPLLLLKVPELILKLCKEDRVRVRKGSNVPPKFGK